MSVNLSLTVTHNGETENGTMLEKGMIVQYRAHVPGGNVKIILPNGKQDIADPRCFQELQ